MELKDIQDELTRIKLTEELTTIEFIKHVFGRHLTVIDLSNHFLFEKSSSLLRKLLKSLFSSKKDLKSLILQNCMISEHSLISILTLLSSSSKSFKSIDLSNNRLLIEPCLARKLSVLFSRSFRLKSLTLQGNIFTSAQSALELFSQSYRLQELNLYDTNLSSEALNVISQALASNFLINKLNLGFNSQAFEDPDIVRAFAEAVAENRFIEHLNLSSNESLGEVDNLQQLCEGLKKNRSLSSLSLGGVNLEDFGVKVLITHMLNDLPISSLDLQNNAIQDPGFKTLMVDLSQTITSLDVSYNTLKENSSIVALSNQLFDTKALRRLNISHSFELESFEDSVIDLLCEALMKNDSLSEFLCEGVKLSDDPDAFCFKMNKAIASRKLSLTYKISAVNCFVNNTFVESGRSGERSMKIISTIPSNLSHFEDKESYSQTERKEFVETPDQEPIINTSRQFEISTSFN